MSAIYSQIESAVRNAVQNEQSPLNAAWEAYQEAREFPEVYTFVDDGFLQSFQALHDLVEELSDEGVTSEVAQKIIGFAFECSIVKGFLAAMKEYRDTLEEPYEEARACEVFDAEGKRAVKLHAAIMLEASIDNTTATEKEVLH